MLQPGTLPSAFIQTSSFLHLYFSYPVENLFHSLQFLFSVGNHQRKQSQWLSFMNSWGLVKGSNKGSNLYCGPLILTRYWTEHLLFSSDSLLSIEYLLLTLVVRAIRWFLFSLCLYFHRCQVLKSLKVCPCLFGFWVLWEYFVAQASCKYLQEFDFFLFSCFFCFYLRIQKYAKTMPSCSIAVNVLEYWIFYVVH